MRLGRRIEYAIASAPTVRKPIEYLCAIDVKSPNSPATIDASAVASSRLTESFWDPERSRSTCGTVQIDLPTAFMSEDGRDLPILYLRIQLLQPNDHGFRPIC